MLPPGLQTEKIQNDPEFTGLDRHRLLTALERSNVEIERKALMLGCIEIDWVLVAGQDEPDLLAAGSACNEPQA